MSCDQISCNQGSLGALAKYLDENNLQIVRVNTAAFRTRDDFFNRNAHLIDWSNPDDFRFEDIYVDYKKWLQSYYTLSDICQPSYAPFVEDAVWNYFYAMDELDLGEFFLLLDDDDERSKDTVIDKFVNMTFGEISTFAPKLMDAIEKAISDADWHDLEICVDDLYEEPDLNADVYEQLSYWPVYFEPERKSEDVAWEVGLFPFRYDGDFYLALGGCGMDLSPKLDAYQALTSGSIPSNSQFIRDPEYAEHVVGKPVFDKVMSAIACSPIITIYTESKEALQI
jgi:hypothetical protein